MLLLLFYSTDGCSVNFTENSDEAYYTGNTLFFPADFTAKRAYNMWMLPIVVLHLVAVTADRDE